jgi:hypothetical protein
MRQRSAAEVRNEPEQERQRSAEKEAGNDRKIEGVVFAAMDDVAGKSSQAEGEFAAKVKKSTNKDEESAKNEEGAAKFAKRVHPGILPEPAEKLFPPRTSVSYFLLVLTSRYLSDTDNTH